MLFSRILACCRAGVILTPADFSTLISSWNSGLKETTIRKLVHTGVQPIGHFFWFLLGKEGVTREAKRYRM